MPLQNYKAKEPEGNFEQPHEGHQVVTVKDLQDAGISQWTGKPQFCIIMETAEGVEFRTWATNSWWFKDPAPSKMYELFMGAGLVGKDNAAPEDLNQLIGKKIGVLIVKKKNEKGFIRATVKKFMSPKIAEAAKDQEFSTDVNESVS